MPLCGKRSVLDDPIADLQVPPDIQIQDEQLDLERNHADYDQQPGKHSQL